ncbi:UNVERIFIED_CONTAM: hypothetical protein RMT77_005019 [Armadillidium vulgare]
MYGKHLLPAYLASFPRSGNTWTRVMIEAASGIATKPIDPENVKNDSQYIILKTHGAYNSQNNHSYFKMKRAPVVLLIRNIERSLFSFWSFSSQKERKLKFYYEAPLSSYDTKEFRLYVNETIHKWKKINEDCLLYCKPLLVIFYENLLQYPLKQVKKILDFLGYPVDPHRMECFKRHPQENYKRKITKQIDPFSKPEKKMMASAMFDVIKLIKKRSFYVPKEYDDYISKYL